VQDWPESYRFERLQHNQIVDVDVGSRFINELAVLPNGPKEWALAYVCVASD